MKTLMQGSILACALLVLTGCGNMTGSWKLASIEPPTAADNFEFGKIVLNEDNTFMAEADYEGRTREMHGTYTYDKSTKTLKFHSKHGPDRVYKAELAMFGDKMQVWQTDDEWKATMKRAGDETDAE